MRVERKHYHYLSVLIFNVVLFFVLYYWFATNVQGSALIHDIHRVPTPSIFFIFFVYLLNILIASWRFSKLLPCSFFQSGVLVCITYGLNNLLPFRAGDILRLYFAKRLFSIKVSKTLTATFIARYLDLLVLLILGGLLVVSSHTANDTYLVYLFITLLSFSILALVLYRILVLKPGMLSCFCRKSRFVASVLESVETLMEQRHKTRLFLISLLLWSTVLLVYYSFFKINLPLSPFTLREAILLMFTTTLCFAIPYSFAGIGIFEAAIVYCLVKFVGVSTTQALALAMVFHLAVALPQISLMVLMLLYYRSRLVFSKRDPQEESFS